MATEVAVEVPAAGGFSRRFRERLYVWRRLFTQNWNLFKASRIGVVGLAIMVAFVIIALAAPFMGLRDPIRWTAPDEDLIEIEIFWTKDSSIPGSELRVAPPVTQPVSFRVKPDSFDSRADRLYVAAQDRLYAFATEPDLKGQNAWGTLNYFNVSDPGVPRRISVPPIAMNFGDYVQQQPDYELYLGTDSGRLYLLRDVSDTVPFGTSLVRYLDLDGAITGLAAFNGDMDARPAINGTVEYTRYNGTAWVTERLMESSAEDLGEFASLAMNATDVPYIAAYHLSIGQPRVSVRSGASWPAVGQVEPYDATVNVGLYTSLAIGSDGRPRVAYYDEAPKDLKYAAWNGTAWIRTYVDFQRDVGRYASLALVTGTDQPRIAYYNETSGQLTYAACDAGAGCRDTLNWTIETVPDSGADVGSYASLALDAGGDPHIAYYDASAGALKYVTKTGVAWQVPEVVDAGSVGQYASLALEGGQPRIAYYDAANRTLKYAAKSGTWAAPEVVDDPVGADVGRYASLAIGPSGPAIAYHDATNLDLKFARWNATSLEWENETVARQGHAGLYASMKFDSRGDPHIAHYSYGAGRTTRDVLVAGTANGKLYAIDVGIPGTIARLPRAQQVTSWSYRVRWEVDVGAEVHLAGSPLATRTNIPLYSPAFDRNGTAVFGGTGAGLLLANRTSDGSAHLPRTISLGSPWSSAPVVQLAEGGPVNQREIVYAGSNALTSDDPATPENDQGNSLLHAIFADTGLPLPEWNETYAGFGGAVPLYRSGLIPDGGDLAQPTVEGGTIYIGSTSGYLYAFRRDRVGELEPASPKWKYSDQTLLGLNAEFTSPPVVVSEKSLLLTAANHDGGTPTDPSDDRGVLYSFKLDGSISWKKTFNALLPGEPSIWFAPRSLDYAVWVGYGGTSLTGIMALRTTGNFLAPSGPTWAHTYACPTSTEPGRRCPGYSSGNQYWLGLDSQGRDIFSQVIWGSRIALLVGFLSAFFSVLLGVVVGLLAGYVGGKTESVLMRFTDVILVLPGLPLIITLAAVLGASIWNIILVLSLLGWPGIARIIRAEVLSLKERPFIDSARVTGASTTRIVFRHIAPNVMPLAFLYMTFAVSSAILSEAALSFIGLGDITTMSWGIMLQLVSQSKALTAWWWLLPPGMAITLISLAFFLVGRAFDEIVNPRLRKR